MEILIFIGIGWAIYVWLFKDSSGGNSASVQVPAANKVQTYRKDAQPKRLNRSKAQFDKEPNASVIQRAIENQHKLSFRYIDQEGEISERTATPIMLELRHDSQILCLVAHCHLRNANRTFVVRRMQNISFM